MSVVLIAALARHPFSLEHNVLGANGEIPWRIKEDFKRFRGLTLGHPVIMGRVTYEGIFDKLKSPLDGRTNIVMTRLTDLDGKYKAGNVLVAHSVNQALDLARRTEGIERVYVAGGERVYKDFMQIADELDITEVHRVVCGDVFFPEISSEIWNLASREDKEGYSFVSYVRALKG